MRRSGRILSTTLHKLFKKLVQFVSWVLHLIKSENKTARKKSFNLTKQNMFRIHKELQKKKVKHTSTRSRDMIKCRLMLLALRRRKVRIV